jgi:hypothetical protein
LKTVSTLLKFKSVDSKLIGDMNDRIDAMKSYGDRITALENELTSFKSGLATNTTNANNDQLTIRINLLQE